MIPKTKPICCPMNGRAISKEKLFFKLLASNLPPPKQKNNNLLPPPCTPPTPQKKKSQTKPKPNQSNPKSRQLCHKVSAKVWFCSLSSSLDSQNYSQVIKSKIRSLESVRGVALLRPLSSAQKAAPCIQRGMQQWKIEMAQVWSTC